MRRVCLIALSLWLGCPKARVQDAIDPEQLQAIPRLPAPRSGTYARVPARPSDPVIAALTEKLRWDASLSGAAAGLALDLGEGRSGLHAWEVREAAWDAGYPYPITQVRGWNTPQGASPPQELLAWLDASGPEVDLGLVRARSAQGDSWVALLATPRIDIGVQPRQAHLAGVLELPAVPGARYTVVDPIGRMYEGGLDLPQTFHLDQGGEWLFQVADEQGIGAKFPVYVQMIPPDLALLVGGEAPRSDAELVQQTQQTLAEIREVYGQGSWERDPMLEAAARVALDGKSPATQDLAKRLGFPPDRLWRVECQATTLQDCIDRIVWSPYSRSALISDTRYWGLAARRDQPGVRIVAYVAGE